jgi:hypothetical protein
VLSNGQSNLKLQLHLLLLLLLLLQLQLLLQLLWCHASLEHLFRPVLSGVLTQQPGLVWSGLATRCEAEASPS